MQSALRLQCYFHRRIRCFGRTVIASRVVMSECVSQEDMRLEESFDAISLKTAGMLKDHTEHVYEFISHILAIAEILYDIQLQYNLS